MKVVYRDRQYHVRVCLVYPVLFLWRYEPVRRTGKSGDWLTIFFAHIIRLTVQKFQLFWVIFCIIIFFIELWHILILWLAKMPMGACRFYIDRHRMTSLLTCAWLISILWLVLGLQSKIKICIPENILLQKKHWVCPFVSCMCLTALIYVFVCTIWLIRPPCEITDQLAHKTAFDSCFNFCTPYRVY